MVDTGPKLMAREGSYEEATADSGSKWGPNGRLWSKLDVQSGVSQTRSPNCRRWFKMGCPKVGTKWQTLVQIGRPKWSQSDEEPKLQTLVQNGMPKSEDQMADSGPNLMSKVESDDEAKFADSNTEIDRVQLLSCFFLLCF
jgi:hypothetical protein